MKRSTTSRRGIGSGTALLGANFVAWFVVTFMLLLLVDMVFKWGNGQGQREPGAWNAEQERGRMGKSGKMERSGGDRWMLWMLWMLWMSEVPWLS